MGPRTQRSSRRTLGRLLSRSRYRDGGWHIWRNREKGDRDAYAVASTYSDTKTAPISAPSPDFGVRRNFILRTSDRMPRKAHCPVFRFVSLQRRLPSIQPRSLTAWAQQITISDEYRTCPCGDTFDSKPHAKKGSRKANSGVESPRDDRAPRLDGWFQDRHRSRQKPRLISAE